MKKLLSVLFMLGLTLASVYAQNIQVKGTVASGTDNSPLPGVNVVLKGNTSVGTITDIDGNFSLSVPADAVLTISYIGFVTQDVPVNGQTVLNVSLAEDNETLDEVVVIGYGTARKSDLTGSLSSVSSDSYANQNVTRIDEALQGRAAGIQISNTVGAPGGDVRIRIRGANSVLGDNSPSSPSKC